MKNKELELHPTNGFVLLANVNDKEKKSNIYTVLKLSLDSALKHVVPQGHGAKVMIADVEPLKVDLGEETLLLVHEKHILCVLREKGKIYCNNL